VSLDTVSFSFRRTQRDNYFTWTVQRWHYRRDW